MVITGVLPGSPTADLHLRQVNSGASDQITGTSGVYELCHADDQWLDLGKPFQWALHMPTSKRKLNVT